jgi:apolipoprotein N-acyltransferase
VLVRQRQEVQEVSRPGGLTPAHSIRPWLAAALSGGLLGLAFPTPDLGWLAWICLVPLLVAIRSSPVAEAFRLGYVSGLIAFATIMSWISLFGLPAWAALSAGMAVFLGAFAAGVRWLTGRYGGARGASWLWGVPLTWMAIEVIRSTGPIAFPWALLGLTQYRTPAVLPAASLIGVIGLGGLVAAANALIAELVVRRRITPVWLAATAVGVSLVGGAHVSSRSPASPQRIVGVVQPNIDPRERDGAAGDRYLMRLTTLTADALQRGADVIVYPESTLSAGEAERFARTLLDARRSGSNPSGAPTHVHGVTLDGPRNGALVFNSDGRVAGEYVKRRPVPFGEAGLTPGGPAVPIVSRAGSIAIAICYESAFSELLRPLVAGGSDLIAILTNDGWFGTSAGPAQHASHAVLRAVEGGRSVARAANTGISMLIRPDGTVVADSRLGVETVLVAALPVGGPSTPFVKWGWLIVPAAVVGWLAAAAPAGLRFLGTRSGDVRPAVALLIVPALLWTAGRTLEARGAPGASFAHLAVIALCIFLGRRHLYSRRGFRASLLASLGVTAFWVVAMRWAYAQFGFSVAFLPQDWGQGHIAGALLAGFAAEIWLRGALFGAALRLGGWSAALVASTAVGIALQHGRPQEVVFWHLFSGVIFGVIRLRTGDAVGLGPARAFGDTVFQALSRIR